MELWKVKNSQRTFEITYDAPNAYRPQVCYSYIERDNRQSIVGQGWALSINDVTNALRTFKADFPSAYPTYPTPDRNI